MTSIDIIRELLACTHGDPNRAKGAAEGKWVTVNVPIRLYKDMKRYAKILEKMDHFLRVSTDSIQREMD